jgi:hypothetical protein
MSEANKPTSHSAGAIARAASSAERGWLSLDSWAVLAALALAALVKVHILNAVKW